jgi:hypothetical protein
MRSPIFGAIVAMSLVGGAHASDEMRMNETDSIVYGRPAFAVEGFARPIVAESDEDKPIAQIGYLAQPTLRSALSPQERIDAGHSALEMQQRLDFVTESHW